MVNFYLLSIRRATKGKTCLEKKFTAYGSNTEITSANFLETIIVVMLILPQLLWNYIVSLVI